MTTKSLFSAFKTDANAETHGVWIPFQETNIAVLIARAGGRNHGSLRAESAIAAEHMDRLENMPPEEFAALLAPAYAKHIVLDIRGEGFVGEDGQPMQATPEVITELLVALPDFFDMIRYVAKNRAVFQKAKEDAIAGN